MSGVFSKGSGGTPLTPAQQLQQQIALQSAQDYNRIWAPVQTYFAQSVQANAPGLQENARGAAAVAARDAGWAALQHNLGADTGRGAAASSGAFLADLARGRGMSATGAGLGLTDATAQMQAHYVKGLQDVLSMYRGQQAQAMRGLNTAANEQAQAAGAVQASNQAATQGMGQMVGSGLGLLLMA